MPRVALMLPAILLATLAPTTAAQPTTGAACPYQSCAVRNQMGVINEYLVRGDSGEKVVKINFTGSNATAYLSRVESAAPAARQFRTSRTRGAVLGIIGGVALAYATTAPWHNRNHQWESWDTDEIIAFSIGVPIAIWGGIETVRSRNAISRAIWEFNRAPVP